MSSLWIDSLYAGCVEYSDIRYAACDVDPYPAWNLSFPCGQNSLASHVHRDRVFASDDDTGHTGVGFGRGVLLQETLTKTGQDTL